MKQKTNTELAEIKILRHTFTLFNRINDKYKKKQRRWQKADMKIGETEALH